MFNRAGVLKRIATAVLLIGTMVCAQALAVPSPAGATDGFSVDPGYDLFETRQQPSSYAMIAEIEGVPLGSYTFPATGSASTGATDTIIRRLGTATPGNPVVQTEIEALHLKSVSPRDDLYVTLQKDRIPADLVPPGPPSLGTLHFQFNSAGTGGRLLSSFVVCYDIRLGGFTGTIIHSACDAVSGVQSRWAHDLPSGDSRCLTEMGLLAKHGVFGPPARIAGVNYELNGTDTTHDLVPGFDAEKPCDPPEPPQQPPSGAGSFAFVGTGTTVPNPPFPPTQGTNGTWTLTNTGGLPDTGVGVTTQGDNGFVQINVSGRLHVGIVNVFGDGPNTGLSGGSWGTGTILIGGAAFDLRSVGWIQSAATIIPYNGDVVDSWGNVIGSLIGVASASPIPGNGVFRVVGSGQLTF